MTRFTHDRRTGSGAIARFLDPLRRYLHELDDASRERMQRDRAYRKESTVAREARLDELRSEAALFSERLPRWVEADEGEVGAAWVAAAEIVLKRRGRRSSFAAGVRPARRKVAQATLSAGTRLRLVAVTRPRPVAGADLATAARGRARSRRTFEVLDGPMAGQLVDAAAAHDGYRRANLIAAAMIAPEDDRIGAWADAAASLLRQLEDLRRRADHADAVVRHQEGWAWAHATSAPPHGGGWLARIGRGRHGGDRSGER